MTHIYYETPDMAVMNELKKRNLRTFGGNARRKERLDRFVKFEEKQATKAEWRRSRITGRSKRHHQLWSSDHGQLLPVEPVVVDNGFTWSHVLLTILGIVMIHLVAAIMTLVMIVCSQNGFSFA